MPSICRGGPFGGAKTRGKIGTDQPLYPSYMEINGKYISLLGGLERNPLCCLFSTRESEGSAAGCVPSSPATGSSFDEAGQ
jgi:hypothetical protein